MDKEKLRSELEKLPRWAVVAFAVRCGQRVVPLFDRQRPSDPRPRLALRYATDMAKTTRSDGTASPADASRTAAAGTHADAIRGEDAALRSSVDHAATYAAESVAFACDSADHAFMSAHRTSDSTHTNIAEAAEHAESAAFSAARAIDPACADVARDTAAVDREKLEKLALLHQWTEDTPVDPDLLGPLWSEGKEPEWARAVGTGESTLPMPTMKARGRVKAPGVRPEIEVLLTPGSASPEFIARLFQAISNLHEAHTGVPLVIAKDEFEMRVVEEVTSG